MEDTASGVFLGEAASAAGYLRLTFRLRLILFRFTAHTRDTASGMRTPRLCREARSTAGRKKQKKTPLSQTC